MNLVRIPRAEAIFGYGPGGEIREIADALPDELWQHPQRAWSPLFPSTIPCLERVFLKYEGSHRSGSFKDRIMAASLSEMLAKDPDCPGVVVPSSGNAAVSAAALCASHKLPMIAIVPLAVPVERLQPIVARGGIVLRAGEGPSQSYALADRLSSALGYLRLYSTFASPWAEWGCRALGLELAGQMSSGISQVVSPVSAGPVLVGTANGLLQAGKPLPRLIAVQAAGCAPIAVAFANGALEVTAWSGQVDTKAAAIADRLQGYAQDGTRVLEIVRQSQGTVDAVTDAEMASARAALLEFDGIDFVWLFELFDDGWQKGETFADADLSCLVGLARSQQQILDVIRQLAKAQQSLSPSLLRSAAEAVIQLSKADESSTRVDEAEVEKSLLNFYRTSVHDQTA